MSFKDNWQIIGTDNNIPVLYFNDFIIGKLRAKLNLLAIASNIYNRLEVLQQER